MATHRFFRCPVCREQKRAKSLFSALKAVADNSTPKCPQHATPMSLNLSFDFALDASGKNSVVIASFYPHPPEQWEDSRERTVTFCPFLVVTKREERDQAIWLPYWHLIQEDEKTNHKYGQWAPLMDMELFEDLLTQARCAGFLDPPPSTTSPATK